MTWESRVDQWRQELALFDQLEGWVPLAEAVEHIGVSTSTLRSWYRTGQIRTRLVDGPHGPQKLVRLDEVAARAERSPRIRARAERELAAAAQIELLRDRVDQLELRLLALEHGSGRASGC